MVASLSSSAMANFIMPFTLDRDHCSSEIFFFPFPYMFSLFPIAPILEEIVPCHLRFPPYLPPRSGGVALLETCVPNPARSVSLCFQEGISSHGATFPLTLKVGLRTLHQWVTEQ